MNRFVIAAFLLFLLSCAGTQKQIDLVHLNENIPSFITEELAAYKATGDIVFSIGGEKYRGKIVQSMDKNRNYRCFFYTPFAQLIASIESDKDSATVVIGDQEHRISTQEKIHIIPYFTIFPFSFSEFVRILSGRTIKNDILRQQRITEKREKKQTIAEWKSDSITIALTFIKRKRYIDNVVYSPAKDDSWKLKLSSFQKGLFREFYFESLRGDFFNLTLKKIEF